jgi:hypothetical protein
MKRVNKLARFYIVTHSIKPLDVGMNSILDGGSGPRSGLSQIIFEIYLAHLIDSDGWPSSWGHKDGGGASRTELRGRAH